MSYNQTLEDRIDHFFIDNEKLVKNKNLGWVGWLVKGHMCFGIYDNLLIIRVGHSLGNALLKKPGVEPFEQADETGGQVLSVEPEIYENREVLHQFLLRSLKYTSRLSPKT